MSQPTYPACAKHVSSYNNDEICMDMTAVITACENAINSYIRHNTNSHQEENDKLTDDDMNHNKQSLQDALQIMATFKQTHPSPIKPTIGLHCMLLDILDIVEKVKSADRWNDNYYNYMVWTVDNALSDMERFDEYIPNAAFKEAFRFDAYDIALEMW